MPQCRNTPVIALSGAIFDFMAYREQLVIIIIKMLKIDFMRLLKSLIGYVY